MKENPAKSPQCQICGNRSNLKPAALVRNGVVAEILRDFPAWSSREGFICSRDLDEYRMRYVQEMLLAEKGELSALEEEVVQSIQRQETLSSDVEEEFGRSLSFGERLSDAMADRGGSWTFIVAFLLFLAAWIVWNSRGLLANTFDPYPYILLNLVLSCLAAIQAPIIMMSQNRQEAKDRLRSQNDYRVNLKAELEIRHLHEKVDHLLTRQWERLMEIQQIQLELMEEMTRRK